MRPCFPDVVPAGPDNPLGAYALYLAWPGYLTDVANRPYSIGQPLTYGCIRLHAPDIRRLFETAPIGAPVRIVDQPVKVGWQGDALYLEAHPNRAQTTALESEAPLPEATVDVRDQILAAARRRPPPVEIDWTRAATVAKAHRGIPVAIGQSAAKTESGRGTFTRFARPAAPARTFP